MIKPRIPLLGLVISLPCFYISLQNPKKIEFWACILPGLLIVVGSCNKMNETFLRNNFASIETVSHMTPL